MNLLSLQSLFTGIEAATPDGRWSLLQDWLKKNPEWKERIDQWLALPSDEVVKEMEMIAAEQSGLPALFINKIITPDLKAKAKSAIETLQACYRERAGEMEIKHASPLRNITKRTGKNPGGKTRHIKRTD